MTSSPETWKNFINKSNITKFILFILSIIVTTILGYYILKKSKKHLVISGFVYAHTRDSSFPIYNAKVKMLNSNLEQLTDIKGHYVFSSSDFVNDSEIINVIPDNLELQTKTVYLNFSEKNKQIDTFFYEALVKNLSSIPKQTPKSTNAVYFNNNIHADVAIIVDGTGDKLNLQNLLKKYFNTKGVSSSASFFYPSFLSNYSASIQAGDISILNSLKLTSLIKAICFIKQKITFKTESLDGEDFLTATGKYDITFLNLKENTTNTFSIEQHGAGKTEFLAQQNLEEKFTNVFYLQQFGL